MRGRTPRCATELRFVLGVVLGCASMLGTSAEAQVPDRVPDGLPDEVVARLSDRAYRNRLLLVSFDPSATQAERDSAFARVSATVVGGLPVSDGEVDGWYVAELSDQGMAAGGTYWARTQLGYLPWVSISGDWNPSADGALAYLDRASGDAAGDVLEVRETSRSIWGELDASFAPRDLRERLIRIQDVAPSDGGQRVWTLGNVPEPDERSVHVSVRRDGRTEVFEPEGWIGEPGVRPFYQEALVRSEPEAFLYPFLFGPAGVSLGERAGPHSIALGTDPAQGLRGGRVVSVLRDSTSTWGEGRVIRDSARVTVERNWTTYDYGFADSIRMSEVMNGTIVGIAVIDSLGLARSRTDTVSLSGTVFGELPDGRRIAVPLKYEAEREVRRLDPVSWLTAGWRERGLGGGGAMVVVRELSGLELRVREGDAAALDSVRALWRRAADPAERARWSSMIQASAYWDSPAEFSEFLWAEGDTARYLSTIIARSGQSDLGQVEAAELERLIPYLDDPGRMWRVGRTGGSLYDQLVRAVSDHPPAVTTDTSSWAFTPEAFDVLSGWRERARDPRLKDYATFAWFTLDPAARYPALERRASSPDATPIATGALLLADGQQPWGTGGGVPLPDAPANDWSVWAAGAGPFQTRFHLDFFHAAHPDRDVGAEVARRYATATTEEEMAVFQFIGWTLGTVDLPSPEAIVADAAAGGDPNGLAIRLLLESAGPPPDSVLFQVVDRLLRREVEGMPVWSSIRPEHRRPDRVRGANTGEGNLYLLDSGLPDGIREAWGDRVPIVSQAEWEAMDPHRPAHLIRIGDARMAGPILSFSYSTSGRLERPPVASPHSYASGESFYLAWWEGEWWALMRGMSWIT